MNIIDTTIPGCFLIWPFQYSDDRGSFVKTFHEPSFRQHGLDTEFVEEYYSISKQNVLRGLHFQTPPYEHVKVVYCMAGAVLDVVLDLRKDSPTYGQYEMFQLNEHDLHMVYIPKGLAHGFYTQSQWATMVYKVTSIHHPESDKGVRWDSAGIPWPTIDPVLSERDAAFPLLESWESPFTQ